MTNVAPFELNLSTRAEPLSFMVLKVDETFLMMKLTLGILRKNL